MRRVPMRPVGLVPRWGEPGHSPPGRESPSSWSGEDGDEGEALPRLLGAGEELSRHLSDSGRGPPCPRGESGKPEGSLPPGEVKLLSGANARRRQDVGVWSFYIFQAPLRPTGSAGGLAAGLCRALPGHRRQDVGVAGWKTAPPITIHIGKSFGGAPLGS